MSPLFNRDERRFTTAVSGLAYCNPFLPERIEHEKAALGRTFDASTPPWNVHPDGRAEDRNIGHLVDRAETLVEDVRTRLREGVQPDDRDRAGYEDLVLFVLYHRFIPRFGSVIANRLAGGAAPAPRTVGFYDEFVEAARRFYDVPMAGLPRSEDLPHLFACFFQVRRAFDRIFECILGISEPAVHLRAQAWQSIFTHDLRRYRRTLFDRMGDVTTLVTGPSGTGKELVARAIGLARYVPFDPEQRRFQEDFLGSFHPLNLSALSPTLIESELFGHRRGSFTGALKDHRGWMETCTPAGTVFLDEIGELDPAIQVKLLRVLESRTFQRIGDTATLPFRGKIIAATNRDLAHEMQTGRFREDLYYRLCSDLVTTPTLAARLRDDPAELDHLILNVARRLAGDDAADLANEVRTWIDAHLGADYPWPGNVRELEQCVRNIMIRGHYAPARPRVENDARNDLAQAVRQGTLTADALLDGYCRQIYDETASYAETARRLGLDRRTIKSRVNRPS